MSFFTCLGNCHILYIFENNNRRGEIIFEEKLNHWKFNAVYPQAQLKDRGYG